MNIINKQEVALQPFNQDTIQEGKTYEVSCEDEPSYKVLVFGNWIENSHGDLVTNSYCHEACRYYYIHEDHDKVYTIQEVNLEINIKHK